MDIKKIREYFPFIKKGKIYFNHASSGPLPAPAADRVRQYILSRSENEIDDYAGFIQVAGETKSLLAEMINASSGRIAFLDNTSNGINLLAQSLEWKSGDRILLNDVEFPANVYPFLNLQNEGVEVDFVKSKDKVVSSDTIIEAIKPETKLISVSHVQFLSGYKTDLSKIGKVCREKEIIFSVDAIQALPAVKLNVKESNISFISCGTQKWLLGLPGLAFVFVDEELQKKMHPRYVGWLSVSDSSNLLDYKLTLKKTASAFQSGTLNSAAVYALNSSLKLLLECGLEEIQKSVLNNTKYFQDQLQEIGIDPILKSYSNENLSGIVSIEHPNHKEIFEKLSEKDIFCSVREGLLRFSPYFYNTKEEIDLVISELKKMR
jgi:selenocysteine lyase/cysteine desulfurase